MEAAQQQANQYCGFKIAGEEYAIPVMEVQEVIKPLQVTAVPMAQEEIRGQIVTCISLRKLFQQEENLEHEYMNIIIRGKDGLYSLVVDEVTDIIDVDDVAVEKVPDTVNPRIKRFVDKIYKREKGLVILLKIEELLELQEKMAQ